MAKFADLTGHDGTKYRAKADNLKELINNEWFDAEKKCTLMVRKQLNRWGWR